MRALAVVVVLLACLAYVGAAGADRTNPSTEPACYRGVTYNVPFGHAGLFAFLATHPGATRGMCPAAAAAGGARGPDSSAWLCTPANGPQPYPLNVALVQAAILGGSRYANEGPVGFGPQPNANNTGAFNCLVPDGYRLDTSVLLDNNGWPYDPKLAGGTVGYARYLKAP